jgi:hypothetical protein
LKKLAIGFLLTLSLSVPAWSQECASKVQGLLDRSGHQVKVLAPCRSWMATDIQSVPRGDGLSGVMLFAEQGDVVVVGTVLRTKAKLNLSADLLLKLMQFNNDLDFVKVGIDHDGDLFVREELRTASFTAEDFKDSITRVVAASNKVYAVLDK